MRSRVEFLMEAVLMADFDHPNVMWLIAIIIDSEMVPHVLLPLMQHGDLRSYVSKPTNVSTKRLRPRSITEPKVPELIPLLGSQPAGDVFL